MCGISSVCAAVAAGSLTNLKGSSCSYSTLVCGNASIYAASSKSYHIPKLPSRGPYFGDPQKYNHRFVCKFLVFAGIPEHLFFLHDMADGGL